LKAKEHSSAVLSVGFEFSCWKRRLCLLFFVLLQ